MKILQIISIAILTALSSQAATQKIYEVVLKDVPSGGLVLELAFYSKMPPPLIVDKILKESLEHAVSIDGTRDILAIAFQGKNVLAGTQYSGELVYRANQKKIMTMDESRGITNTINDVGPYALQVIENKTAAGIKPERKWLTYSLIYPQEPKLEDAYVATLLEIEKAAHNGIDITAYVEIGDKAIKTARHQMKDPSGGFVFMRFEAASKKVYQKSNLLKIIE